MFSVAMKVISAAYYDRNSWWHSTHLERVHVVLQLNTGGGR